MGALELCPWGELAMTQFGLGLFSLRVRLGLRRRCWAFDPLCICRVGRWDLLGQRRRLVYLRLSGFLRESSRLLVHLSPPLCLLLSRCCRLFRSGLGRLVCLGILRTTSSCWLSSACLLGRLPASVLCLPPFLALGLFLVCLVHRCVVFSSFVLLGSAVLGSLVGGWYLS